MIPGVLFLWLVSGKHLSRLIRRAIATEYPAFHAKAVVVLVSGKSSRMAAPLDITITLYLHLALFLSLNLTLTLTLTLSLSLSLYLQCYSTLVTLRSQCDSSSLTQKKQRTGDQTDTLLLYNGKIQDVVIMPEPECRKLPFRKLPPQTPVPSSHACGNQPAGDLRIRQRSLPVPRSLW